MKYMRLWCYTIINHQMNHKFDTNLDLKAKNAWTYRRDDGVAFKLAILDNRRLCRFEFNIILGGSLVSARYNRSISSRVFPCVSGTMKITKNTETKQIKAKSQNTP